MTITHSGRLIVDGSPIEFAAGDNLLVAMLRAGVHPTGGGCLCLAGDCPHCVATVDGISYVRTCQVAARAGMVVERHPADGYPPLPDNERIGAETVARHLHCDVVVIGMGEAGKAAAAEAQAAGKKVMTLDTYEGQEAIGIYAGPLVVARTDAGMLHIHAHDEVIVATGAAEIQPVAEGNLLAGLVTARAASQLAAAGIDLGRVVAIGVPPEGVEAQRVTGEVVRFEGEGQVEAVVVRDEAGNEARFECDTVSLGLGMHPRDALRRMGNDLPVRAVGKAALESDIPPCPKSGMLCPCTGVQTKELDFIWNRGFHELELVKRATLAGTGTCQGSVCIPHIRSFLAERGKELQPPFTARPVTRQLTIGEISAGSYLRATPRTALDGEHRRLGAQMERIGGWWRPWTYGDTLQEYWAVREAVSIGDVSTLGKMIVSGPDALELLERLYPTNVSTIRPGRSRYVLLLDERGYVLDDGLICCENKEKTRYTLTFTSGGSSHAELWVRDWAESWGLDVRLLNQTTSLGAINVTGPLSNELLARAGFEVAQTASLQSYVHLRHAARSSLPQALDTNSQRADKPLKYMHHTTATIAGVKCKLFRLSFTGELSYELHHPAEHSVTLWRRLLELGQDLGIKPHGLEALLKLRLEKGHIIVGQDTDFDSTPRRIHHEWAVKLSKAEFVGRQAVIRTNKIPLDRQLVGLEMAGEAPIEGAIIWNGAEYAGNITSSTYSPVLGKAVMLGWVDLFNGQLPTELQIDGRPARRVPVPFYDPEGNRARA